MGILAWASFTASDPDRDSFGNAAIVRDIYRHRTAHHEHDRAAVEPEPESTDETGE
jgi:hypothetical protein